MIKQYSVPSREKESQASRLKRSERNRERTEKRVEANKN